MSVSALPFDNRVHCEDHRLWIDLRNDRARDIMTIKTGARSEARDIVNKLYNQIEELLSPPVEIPPEEKDNE